MFRKRMKKLCFIYVTLGEMDCRMRGTNSVQSYAKKLFVKTRKQLRVRMQWLETKTESWMEFPSETSVHHITEKVKQKKPQAL